MEKIEGLKLKGYKGTWYEIDRLTVNDTMYILLESEKFGDEVSGIVIDEHMNIIEDDAYDDLETELQNII
jgi:hypothetical protein